MYAYTQTIDESHAIEFILRYVVILDMIKGKMDRRGATIARLRKQLSTGIGRLML